MIEPKRILVMHPMAIGDVVLGTPVAAALRRSFPSTHISYYTHESLFPLLQLCSAIDDCLPWSRKAPLLKQLKELKKISPDLIIDLTGSFRTRLLCLLSGIKHYHYRKQPRSERPVVHVSNRYMDVIKPIVAELPASLPLFPTLLPNEELLTNVRKHVAKEQGEPLGFLIAIVPGVGHLRPNRAWPEQHWVDLVGELLNTTDTNLVLVGGPDDADRCQRIFESCGGNKRLSNFAGRLTLPETSALLKLSIVTVSGDTGPCHIAVSVGTPVVSMMGPTLQQRSGPFGNERFAFDASAQCKCTAKKRCALVGFNAHGACMETIPIQPVLKAITTILETHCKQIAGSQHA